MDKPTGTVQRWDVGVCYCTQGIHIDRVKNADGDYVTYDDHKAAIDALAAQAVALATKTITWCDTVLENITTHSPWGIQAAQLKQQAQALLDAQGRT